MHEFQECIHVAYGVDYRPPNVPQVELLTHRLYGHGTYTSWKSVHYPSKWCLFGLYHHMWWYSPNRIPPLHEALLESGLRAVPRAVEVSFDQLSTTRTYYRLYIYHLYIIYRPLRYLCIIENKLYFYDLSHCVLLLYDTFVWLVMCAFFV